LGGCAGYVLAFKHSSTMQFLPKVVLDAVVPCLRCCCCCRRRASYQDLEVGLSKYRNGLVGAEEHGGVKVDPRSSPLRPLLLEEEVSPGCKCSRSRKVWRASLDTKRVAKMEEKEKEKEKEAALARWTRCSTRTESLQHQDIGQEKPLPYSKMKCHHAWLELPDVRSKEGLDGSRGKGSWESDDELLKYLPPFFIEGECSSEHFTEQQTLSPPRERSPVTPPRGSWGFHSEVETTAGPPSKSPSTITSQNNDRVFWCDGMKTPRAKLRWPSDSSTPGVSPLTLTPPSGNRDLPSPPSVVQDESLHTRDDQVCRDIELVDRIEKHVISWPSLSIIELEDHLCRAPNIWLGDFIERHDRANRATENERASAMACFYTPSSTSTSTRTPAPTPATAEAAAAVRSLFPAFSAANSSSSSSSSSSSTATATSSVTHLNSLLQQPPSPIPERPASLPAWRWQSLQLRAQARRDRRTSLRNQKCCHVATVEFVLVV